MRELIIREDHVSMTDRVNPTDTLPVFIQRLKRETSRMLRKQLPQPEEFLMGEGFGRERYSPERVGKMDEEVVRRQKKERLEKSREMMSTDL